MAQSGSPKSLDFASVLDGLMLARGSTEEFNHLFFPGDADGDQNLSKSDYAKVIFCDLYYNTDSTVGCRFQITDNVHEDPCDYIGLYKIGYDSLSQCLASKILSQTECEDDGKLLRCTFKPTELPDLENGFYQFLYVTRDKEVCGASMPFEIKNTIPKDYPSDEDIVADSTEDDFLVVRSNVAEKNRQLQLLLDEMNEKCLAHESEMKKFQEQFKILNEEKLKLEQLLKKACEEKIILIDESQRLSEERNTICNEKEEAIRILKEKNAVLSTIFDDFSCKLKEFTDLRDALEAEKFLTVAENLKLQDRVKKLTEDLKNKQKELDEKEKNQESTSILRKENSFLNSQLDDARLMIEALEKSKQLSLKDLSCLSENLTELKQKFKVMKCENIALKMLLKDSQTVHKKSEEKVHDMMSEIAALKLHIVEMTETNPPAKTTASTSQNDDEPVAQRKMPTVVEDKCTAHSPAKMTVGTLREIIETSEYNNLKVECDELRSELEEKNSTITKLKEEIVKSNAVIDFLTKDRDSVQKNGSLMRDAFNECLLRMNEASELYKKQYRKIYKLKKKMNRTSFSDDRSEFSSLRDLGSNTDTADEGVPEATSGAVPEVALDAVPKAASGAIPKAASGAIPKAASGAVPKASSGDVPLSQSQNSDSDTGEHVGGRVIEKPGCRKLESILLVSTPSHHHIHSTLKARSPSSVSKQVPELQTMIEDNLEKLKNCKSKDEDTMYALPCPVCDQEIGILMSSTDEMVQHLEVQHQQQLCPICGRLFDMTLPSKYFEYHVEDHFKKGDK